MAALPQEILPLIRSAARRTGPAPTEHPDPWPSISACRSSSWTIIRRWSAIIRNLLKQLGFEEVDDASDGTAALARLKNRKYGLVISDWNMEPMTGYELLRHVRADEALRTTPFIMVTAESKTENVIAAKKAGVNNYIVKPFNAATLKSKIEAVCGA